jgi:hypothetical protein
MRLVLASLIDSVLIGAVAFVAFRLAIWATPCSDLGSCPLLTPLIVIFILIGLGLYIGLGRFVWHSTVGRGVLGLG